MAEPCARKVRLQQAGGIDPQDVVLRGAIGPKQPAQSLGSNPEEDLAIDEPIPLLSGQAVWQGQREPARRHGSLVPQNDVIGSSWAQVGHFGPMVALQGSALCAGDSQRVQGSCGGQEATALDAGPRVNFSHVVNERVTLVQFF
jgi:hypothetical protein